MFTNGPQVAHSFYLTQTDGEEVQALITLPATAFNNNKLLAQVGVHG
jgi:hypothetical protein